SLARPPARHDLGVALLAERRAEGDQRDSLGAGFEVPGHVWADPEDVPLLQVVHLVVELDPARALRDHVDLLLCRVLVPERLAHPGRQLLDADAADLATEMAPREANVHALRHLELRGDVLDVA